MHTTAAVIPRSTIFFVKSMVLFKVFFRGDRATPAFKSGSVIRYRGPEVVVDVLAVAVVALVLLLVLLVFLFLSFVPFPLFHRILGGIEGNGGDLFGFEGLGGRVG